MHTLIEHAAMNAPIPPPAGTADEIQQPEILAWLGQLYPRLMAGEHKQELLNTLCGLIGRRFGQKLVTVSRATSCGVLEIIARSEENELWADLQHVPQRFDEGLTSLGPAGNAMRTRKPVQVAATDPSVLIWRAALERKGVSHVLSWPFDCAGQEYVLEMFSARELKSVPLVAVVSAVVTLVDHIKAMERQRLLANAMESMGNAAFITDLNGSIVWCNAALLSLSGHAEDEVVGNNPRFLKSGQQGVRYYRELWSTIRGGKVWSGETVERDHEGRSYTVQQTVSPIASQGRASHYLSVQSDISREVSRRESLERVTGRDPISGLLTRAAFDATGADALLAAENAGQSARLALISIGSVRDGFGKMTDDMAAEVQTRLGEQITTALDPAVLACSTQPGEYLLLSAGSGSDQMEAQVEAVKSALREPLPLLGEDFCRDIVTAVARYPDDGRTLRDLRLSADHAMVRRPVPAARRSASH
jgi:PAS domain S-box-containing protein